MKKLLISLLLVIQLFIFVAVPLAKNAKAATTDPSDNWPWYTPGFWAFGEKVFNEQNPDEIFGERYTAAQVKWIFYSLVQQMLHDVLRDGFYCMIINRGDLDSCTETIHEVFFSAETPEGSSVALNNSYETNTNKSSIPSFFFSYLNNNPISGTKYLIDKTISLREKFSPIKEVHAQNPGFGYSVLKGGVILTLWSAVRNITYFISVLIIIVMAFMIMFRTKISPQTVITVQSALPKIIISLILITFSFAIAGLLIDLTYVLIGLVTTIIHQSGLIDTTKTQWSDIFSYFTSGPRGRGFFDLMDYYLKLFLPALISAIFKVSLGGGLGGMVLGLFGSLLSPIIILLVIIVLIIASFKIFFALIKIYLNIILNIIAGPIVILMGLISPGMGFSSWVRNLMSNLLAYPAIAVLFFLAITFEMAAMSGLVSNLVNFLQTILNLLGGKWIIFSSNISSGSSWAPPMTVGEAKLLPILYLFVSLGIMLLIPKVAEIIKSAITGKQFAYGSAIGEGLAPFMAGYGLARSQVRGGLGYGISSAMEGATAAGGPLGSWLAGTKYGAKLITPTNRGWQFLQGLIKNTGARMQKY